jgi:hypothetical protein
MEQQQQQQAQEQQQQQQQQQTQSGAPIPQEHIAVAAYYNAERRGFAGGRDLDDWLEAERFLIDRRRQPGADGAGVSRGLDHPARDGYGAPAAEIIEPDQVAPWADMLQVAPETLRLAMQRCGPRVEDIKVYLAQESSGAPQSAGAATH